MNLAKNQAKISMDDPLETLNDDCLSVLSKGIITDGSDDGDERTVFLSSVVLKWFFLNGKLMIFSSD